MSTKVENFDKRAASVHKLVAPTGKVPATLEGGMTKESLKDSIVVDLKSAIKQLDALRTSTNDRKAVDIGWGEYIKEKWGFAPSENGQPDSFYEFLGINPSMHSMESFNTSPEFNSDYRWVIPEIIREAVRLGLRKTPIYNNLIAAEETVTQPSVIMPYINMSDATPAALGEVETIPTGTISYGQKTITLQKVGTGIKVSDEVNQYVSLNVLSLYLQDVGVKLGLALDNLAVTTLINGEQADASAAAATIGVANTTNGITYYDLLRAWIRMGRIGRLPQVLLSNEDIALGVLNLSEFKGFAGQAKVPTQLQIQNPIPNTQKFYVHGSMPSTNKLMLIDTANALIKFNSTALKIEADRIVEKGLSATYLNLTTGFATMFRDARLLIDASVAYSSQGFPSWMDASAAEAVNFK